MSQNTTHHEHPMVPLEPRPRVETGHLPEEENEKTAAYSFELRPRILTVESTQLLSPTMVRVRFTADDGLEGFPAIAPEDHVKLFFDREEDGRVRLPPLVEGRWSPRGMTYRDYTIRWFEPRSRTIDIDFVLHGHGTAGRWAETAAPGDTVGALGPRGAFLVKDVFPWYVMAADETALPALARWVEVLRPGVPVHAYIEVSAAASRLELPSHADLTVTWVERPAGVAPSTGLAEAIMRHEYPDTDGFVWVAGESMGIKPARRWLRHELGLDRDHWDVDGYWRQGTSNHDHHHDDEGGDEE